jgi:hypothetical protein
MAQNAAIAATPAATQLQTVVLEAQN